MTTRGVALPAQLLLILFLSACSVGRTAAPAPLSIEFGQGRFLTDAYLEGATGSRCGPPNFAPGGVEAWAPLPDGSWFRVFAISGAGTEGETVILQRGVGDAPAQLTMRLDGREGIVRLDDAGRQDAWGMYHPWANWLREVGERVRSLECARAE